MNQKEARRLAQLDQALSIAADMFAKEGYCAPSGDDSPAAIRRFLLKKAKEELRTLLPPEKEIS